MISRQQSRRLTSLVIMLALLLWAQLGVATMPASGHGPQCHGHMSVGHSAAHGIHAGCCPRHLSATHECPSHPTLAIAPADHPGCCAISNRPSQPLAFVVTARTLMQSGIQVSAGLNPTADATDGATRPDQSPPILQSVFDKKADLRI